MKVNFQQYTTVCYQAQKKYNYLTQLNSTLGSEQPYLNDTLSPPQSDSSVSTFTVQKMYMLQNKNYLDVHIWVKTQQIVYLLSVIKGKPGKSSKRTRDAFFLIFKRNQTIPLSSTLLEKDYPPHTASKSLNMN